MAENAQGLTRTLSDFIVSFEAGKIPPEAFEHARVAFLDWVAVTMAGKDDPLVHKLIRYADIMGGNSQSTIIGHKIKKSVAQAALINGSASHALDYDDTLALFFGHPSVTLFPALLALSEWKEKSGRDFLTAYLVGLQAGTTIGASAGFEHYMVGWHATATIGHLASAAGCARLLGLDRPQVSHALGIAGTQASGLKRVFGTMCKPFHAGMASEAGLMAAVLAGDGFTSAEDILEGPHGFFAALKGAEQKEMVGRLGVRWEVEDLAQKYHASCHATHSPLEAVWGIVREKGIALDDIKSITVHSSQLALDAAGKMHPGTGLEGKFSIPYCVANALLRGVTGMEAFTDEKVNDPAVKALMDKVKVVLDPEIKALESRVEVEVSDGAVYSGFSDILQEIPPLNVKRERIASKAMDLCVPVLGSEGAKRVVDQVMDLERIPDMRRFAESL
ncbi:MAG: MmgE/PrpD family protein [Dehalococcoidia bacterium]|nr:MmgE/PrpD family protein [Dehalococcoidia bacterium]